MLGFKSIIKKFNDWLGYIKFRNKTKRLLSGYYHEIWDVHLNQLMDNHDFIMTGEYTARLGEINIWVGNHPYASFRRYDEWFLTSSVQEKQRPSKKTLYRAEKKLKEDNIKQYGRQPTRNQLLNSGRSYFIEQLNRRYPETKPKKRGLLPKKEIKRLNLC